MNVEKVVISIIIKQVVLHMLNKMRTFKLQDILKCQKIFKAWKINGMFGPLQYDFLIMYDFYSQKLSMKRIWRVIKQCKSKMICLDIDWLLTVKL